MVDSIPNVLNARTMTDRDTPDDLARCIRTLRDRAGWTQQELADRAGIAQTVVSRMESGPNPAPRMSTLAKLASAFVVHVDVLLGNEPLPGTVQPPGAPKANARDTITIPRRLLLAMLHAWREDLDSWGTDADSDAPTPEDFMGSVCRCTLRMR